MTDEPEMTDEQHMRLFLWRVRYSQMSLPDWMDRLCISDPDLAQKLWPGIFGDDFGDDFEQR